MSRKTGGDPWTKALRHLKKADPRLAEVIAAVGPCRLERREDRFGTLVASIVSQQISTKAAASILERLHVAAGRPLEPGRLVGLGEEALRACGLSAGKARYVLNLAAAVSEGSAPLDAFDDGWDDEAIIASLTAIKGIGVWTAHMFLIFALNRPDVLPVGDLGVRMALKNLFGLVELPNPSECTALAEAWSPHRTVASWYLWRSLEKR